MKLLSHITTWLLRDINEKNIFPRVAGVNECDKIQAQAKRLDRVLPITISAFRIMPTGVKSDYHAAADIIFDLIQKNHVTTSD